MKTIPLVLITFLSLINISSAIVISGFGSSEQNGLIPADFIAPWTGIINTTTASVTSVSNESGGFSIDLSANGRSFVNINSNNQLSLTGTLSSFSGSINSFQIELFDEDFDSVFVNYSWTAFNGGATVTSALSSNAAFSGNVTYVNLNLGGLTGETVSFTFDNLSAVPEPSTYTLMGLGLGAMFLARRLRKAVV